MEPYIDLIQNPKALSSYVSPPPLLGLELERIEVGSRGGAQTRLLLLGLPPPEHVPAKWKERVSPEARWCLELVADFVSELELAGQVMGAHGDCLLTRGIDGTVRFELITALGRFALVARWLRVNGLYPEGIA